MGSHPLGKLGLSFIPGATRERQHKIKRTENTTCVGAAKMYPAYPLLLDFKPYDKQSLCTYARSVDVNEDGNSNSTKRNRQSQLCTCSYEMKIFSSLFQMHLNMRILQNMHNSHIHYINNKTTKNHTTRICQLKTADET
jgi:hypothetical protein